MIYKFPHPEWFDGIEKPQISSEDTIILWGAGKVGSVVAHAAEKHGLNVKAFVDTAKDKQGTKFCGYDVISPRELYDNYPEAAVIVSCAYPTVYHDLLSSNFKRAYDPHCLLLEVDFDGYSGGLTNEFASRITKNALENFAMYYGTGRLIDKIFFAITDKCSLNCLNCDGYIPFHVHPQNDTPGDVFKCYERLIKTCGYVEAVDIFGGEPLLHPEIAEIVDFFVQDDRCNIVSIISNGTIIPNADLIKVLKSPKCVLRISDYGELSKKKEEISSLCKREHVQCEITNYQCWDRVPLIQEMSESPAELDKKYAACTRNYLYVKHGKVFQCPFTMGISNLGENVLPNFERNYIDLLEGSEDDLEETVKKFVDRLYKQHHIDACKYCPGSHCLHFEDKVPVAEQAKGKLPLDLLYKDGVRLCD